MRIFSSGGGVQSTACLVLAAQGKIDYPVFVFSNVGDDSEMPDTLDYVRNIAVPYANKHGIEFVETQKRRQGKFEPQSIYSECFRRISSVPIPAYMNTGAPGNRTCTIDFKIQVVDKWIAENGGKGQDVTVGLGISTDEIHRARSRQPEKVRGFMKSLHYPLIDELISRAKCATIISSAGLPHPPRSACFFCPFHTPGEWIRIKANFPELFQTAIDLEKHLQEKRERLGKDKVWLHRSLKPLKIAVGNQGHFSEVSSF